VSARSLTNWAEMWIRRRGMPEVDVAWSCTKGKVASFPVSQQDVLGEGVVWPVAAEAMLGYADGSSQRLRLNFDTQKALVAEAVGRPCPAYVFANAGDKGYGLFLLDDRSRAYVMEHMGEMRDGFTRSLLWGSLWQSVQNAKLAPQEYLDLALKSLPGEQDETITASILAHAELALHRYVGARVREDRTERFAVMAAKRMMEDPDQNLRIVWFRSAAGFAQSPTGRKTVKALLAGTMSVPGVQLRQQDRWRLVTALVALGDPEANKFLAEEQRRDSSGDGKKYAWVAQAARPDAATKRGYFDAYLHDAERPEDWIESSLGAFNSWNQAALTKPYLEPALTALAQIKRQRKIFFLVDWLNAFVGGQSSAAAQAAVYGYLRDAAPDPDLRLKILQAADELDRTIKIRSSYPSE
jgi:aminopeptidase N